MLASLIKQIDRAFVLWDLGKFSINMIQQEPTAKACSTIPLSGASAC